MIKLSPSILAADFTKLGSEVDEIKTAGADYVHFDVMDGVFVPNISVGIPVLRSLRRATDMFLDVHLMIECPGRYVRAFSEAGADLITVHVEADTTEGIFRAIREIKSLGKKAGLSLKPGTAVSEVIPFMPEIDLVLVMTVEPGFGGQKFMESQLGKIGLLRRYIDDNALACELEVDGGIDAVTSALVKNAGANVLVAGSAVFGADDRKAAIDAIRNS